MAGQTDFTLYNDILLFVGEAEKQIIAHEKESR